MLATTSFLIWACFVASIIRYFVGEHLHLQVRIDFGTKNGVLLLELGFEPAIKFHFKIESEIGKAILEAVPILAITDMFASLSKMRMT